MIMPRKKKITRVRGSDEPLPVDGYVRVSMDEQAREGVSLINQEDRIRAYCKLYGLDLVRIATDAGVSAKTLDADGLATVLDDMRQGRVDGVVILKLDRLTRRLRHWEDLIDEFFSEKAGRRLFSVNDSIDTRTPSGRMVLNIIMTVAQWEREEIGFRTRNACRGRSAAANDAAGYASDTPSHQTGKPWCPIPENRRRSPSCASGNARQDLSRDGGVPRGARDRDQRTRWHLATRCDPPHPDQADSLTHAPNRPSRRNPRK